MAAINETLKQPDEALATYLEIAERHERHVRAPEALFRFAELTLRSRRKEKLVEARRVLADVVDRYGQSPWAAKALLAKGELEEQQKYYERDSTLGTSVPSALVTYRRLTTAYADSPAAERAFVRLANIYENMKLFAMAAETFSLSASRYPHTSGDAWFRAAELYRRRLNDGAKARAAYQRVPVTSRHFADAQKQLD
jgi:TolA-binding protein